MCGTFKGPLKSRFQPITWQHLLLDLLLYLLFRPLVNLGPHLTLLFLSLGTTLNYHREWANSGWSFVPKAINLSLLALRFTPLPHSNHSSGTLNYTHSLLCPNWHRSCF